MAETPSLENALGSTLSRSFDVFKQDFVLYLLAFLVYALVSGLSLGLLAGPLSIGLIDVVRRRSSGDTSVSVGDVFGGFSKFVPSFLALLVIGLASAVGSLLFLLPGLFVVFVCAFSLHVMAYEDTGMVESIKRSVRLTLDNALFVLLVLLIIGVLSAVGSLVVIGVLVTGPFSAVMLNVAYEQIAKP
ncbi:MAG: hypothetical protein AAF658_04245 [Myxococcota bacterium]